MKVKLTFVLSERDRKAIALHAGTKRLATRSQVLVWLATIITEQKIELKQRLKQHELNSDPEQQTIPGVLADAS